MDNCIIYSSEDLCVEYFKSNGSSNKLAFVFSPSRNRKLVGNPYGGDFLVRHGFDVISFKSSVDQWFQQVPSDIFDRIDGFLSGKSYEKRFAYGSSMGGYAAVAFSRLLKIDFALLLSPQFSISDDFDRRWIECLPHISWRYFINSDSISPNCDFVLVYDEKDLDAIHAKKIATLVGPGKIKLFSIPYSGHPTTHYLNDLGLVKDVLVKFFSGGFPDEVLLRKDKRRSRAYLNALSQTLFKKGKLATSLSLIDMAIGIAPGIPEYYRHRAVLSERLGLFDQSIISMRQAVALKEDNPFFRQHLSRLLSLVNFEEEAACEAAKAVILSGHGDYFVEHHRELLAGRQVTGDDSEISRKLYEIKRKIRACEKVKDFSKALALAEEAVSLSPFDEELRLKFSRLLDRQGLVDAALRHCLHAITLKKGNSDAYCFYSLLLLKVLRVDDALDAINQAINLNQERADFYRARAIILDKSGDFDQAALNYSIAVSKNTQDPSLWHQSGSAHLKIGRLSDALAASKKALELAPDNPRFMAQFGNVSEKLGLYEQALMAIDRAISIDSEVASFHWLRAVILSNMNDQKSASDAIKNACALDPQNVKYSRFRQSINANAV